jgi:transposase
LNLNNQIKRANPKFTLEFKQDAVKLISEQGYTHQQAADSLGISLSAIGRWSRAESEPANPSSTKTATLNLAYQAELLRLHKEIEQLRMEREIIPKGTEKRGLACSIIRIGAAKLPAMTTVSICRS